jgi:exoribonuclease II
VRPVHRLFEVRDQRIGDRQPLPELFLLMQVGLWIAAAHAQYTEWRVRRFVRFARTQLVLKRDATGWELYDRSGPPRRIYGGHVAHDKVRFCKQNPQAAEDGVTVQRRAARGRAALHRDGAAIPEAGRREVPTVKPWFVPSHRKHVLPTFKLDCAMVQ